MDKLELLRKYENMAQHNLFCYSKNLGMTKPKEGYEKQWKQANVECKLLGEMIQEILEEVLDSASEGAREMSPGEFATHIAEWANKNLICKAHAVRFLKIVTHKITKERPWFGGIEVS